MIKQLLLNLATWLRFPGSSQYWELRYKTGGTSGAGSYGAEATYKTDFLNTFMADNGIHEVVDFGCGDGNQIAGFVVDRYLGVDVSPSAVERCRARYSNDPSKTFVTVDQFKGGQHACALSLDVLYHLVEEEEFNTYLDRLFNSSSEWVVIYASDTRDKSWLRGRHVVRRPFTPIVRERFPQFRLISSPARPPEAGNPGADASFFVYRRSTEN